MDIVQIIDELEQEFAGSKNFLWSKKTLVDMEKCASLIAELKSNLPSAIQEASYVLSKKDQILNKANSDAKKTIAEAEFRAEQLVSSSEIFKRSEQEANEMIEKANRKCNELYSVTKENVDKMLKSVEMYLGQNLTVIKRNRDELESAIKKIQAQPSVSDEQDKD
jgi:vacuolar-type H+-ATPase subunit H